MASIQCFTSNVELRVAVLEYVQPGISSSPNSDVAIQYGWPINNWCVSKVTDFSRIFTPPDGNDVSTLFNENIADWDMSLAVNLTSMFEGAYAFDQDISSWNVSNVITMDRMFYRAFSFNQNLCPWSNRIQLNQNKEFSATDAFVDTGCAQTGDPILTMEAASPFCYECVEDDVTLPPTTIDPRQTPIENKTDPPSLTNSGECFPSKVLLDLALAEYLLDNGPNTDVARRYGWPINNWCVSNITDFSRLFSPVNNLDKASFNEDISNWDMSNAITVESMFERNLFFNQDLSNWNLGLKLQNAARMFFGAKSFNHNLCQWGAQDSSVNVFAREDTNVTQMFRDTACNVVLDPIYNNLPQPGPFCYECETEVVDSSTPEESQPNKTPPMGAPIPGQTFQPTRQSADQTSQAPNPILSTTSPVAVNDTESKNATNTVSLERSSSEANAERCTRLAILVACIISVATIL
jgi:surface protein